MGSRVYPQGLEDFLQCWWASEYELVGFRVGESGLSRRDWWASVSLKVGFRVNLYKEAREHEIQENMSKQE